MFSTFVLKLVILSFVDLNSLKYCCVPFIFFCDCCHALFEPVSNLVVKLLTCLDCLSSLSCNSANFAFCAGVAVGNLRFVSTSPPAI